MPYIPYQPKPGDFGLSRIGGTLGWWVNLAQAMTGDSSRYTHAFVILDDETVLEARPGGASILPLATYHPHNALVSRFALSETQRADIVKHARSLEGTPYSFLDYLSLALLHIGITPKRIKRRIASSGHMICSQLVDEVYLRAGVHLFSDGREPGDVTPGDLLYTLLDDSIVPLVEI